MARAGLRVLMAAVGVCLLALYLGLAALAYLARALRKIERATRAHHGPLSTLYVRGEDEDPLVDLFSTHPDTERRVERLWTIADEQRRRIPVR